MRSAEERYKVWPTNKDRLAFIAAMSGHPDNGPLGRAYSFLSQRTQAFVVDGDGGAGPDDTDDEAWLAPALSEAVTAAEPPERADALVDTVRDLLRLVVIELETEKGDDPQVIFETLNSTGTPLLPSDLVKNHLFNRAQTAGLDVDRLDTDYWRDLDDPWFAGGEEVGRRDRMRLNLVIGFWTALSNPRGSDVTHSRVFESFREVAQARSGPAGAPDGPGVADLFRDLHHHAMTYRRLRTAAYDSIEGRFMARLRDLSTTTPMPLVLWLAGQIGDGVPRAQFHVALRATESYLVRRATCGMTAKNYNRVFAQTLERAKKADSVAVGDVITAHLAGYTEDSVRWPDDDDFEHALIAEPQYRRPLRARRVRMLLEAIEAELRGPDVEQLAPPSGQISGSDAPTGTGRTTGGKALTIEHILPQRWRGTWPLAEALSAHGIATEVAAREQALHTIGNLTLVTGKKNTGLSNQAWSAKRSYLASSSLLMLTQALALASPLAPGDTRDHGPTGQERDEFFHRLWDEQPTLAIRVRGVAIAKWALRVWPRPTP